MSWRVLLTTFFAVRLARKHRFEIVHRPGRTNTVADALSRRCDYVDPDAGRVPEERESLSTPVHGVVVAESSSELHHQKPGSAPAVKPDKESACKPDRTSASWGAVTESLSGHHDLAREQTSVPMNLLRLTSITVEATFAKKVLTASTADREYQRVLRAVQGGSRTDFSLGREGLLYFNAKGLRLYVPVALRNELLREAHDVPIAGHLGRAKTLERLQRSFYWPKMQHTVMEYIKTCESCQRNKPSNQKPMGLLSSLPIPERNWDMVSLDFVPALPPTTSGFNSIAVFVDCLGKRIHIAPTVDTVTAEGTAELYWKTVFLHHGLPKILVSDRDPRFTSKFWKHLTRLSGTRLNMSTANHAQTDGQTERANRTIEDMLRAYVSPFQNDWDKFLVPVEFAYNDSVQASTGQSPFFLEYGYHPRSPLSTVVSADPATRDASASAFVSRMRQLIESARTALRAAQERQAKYADQHRRDFEFYVGDRVLLSASHLRVRHAVNAVNKLAPLFYGPYEVVEVISRVAYRLKLPPHFRIHPVIHISHLKAFNTDEDPASTRVVDPPPTEIIDGNEHFPVEAFLDRRYSGTRTQFLVKWEGYGEDHLVMRRVRRGPQPLASCS